MIAAIIGAGVIGGGWAARFALMGWDVRLYDPADGAQERFAAVYANAERSFPALFEHALPAPGTITWCDSVADAVKDAAWIQESAPEQLSIKYKVFASIQEHCSKEALIGSSTSGFTPTELTQESSKPEQIFVAHPFNPVYLLPLVELVGNAGAVARAANIISSIAMHPLRVRQEIGAHIADRLLEAVWRESLWLVNDGIAMNNSDPP